MDDDGADARYTRSTGMSEVQPPHDDGPSAARVRAQLWQASAGTPDSPLNTLAHQAEFYLGRPLPAGVKHQGVLEKRSDWIRAWRVRHFQLMESGVLVYFASLPTPSGVPGSSGRDPRGMFALVRQGHDAKASPVGQVGLAIVTRQQTLHLRAATPEERDAWCAAVGSVVAAQRLPAPPPASRG